jgi:hypothetical protein
MPLARAIRSAVQWVVSVGGSANVKAASCFAGGRQRLLP